MQQWQDIKCKNQRLDAREFEQGNPNMKISEEDEILLSKIYNEEIEDKEQFPRNYFKLFGLKYSIHRNMEIDARHFNIMSSIDGSSVYRPFIDLKSGKTISHLFWKSTKDKTMSPFRTCYFNKIWSYIEDYQLNDPAVIEFVEEHKMGENDTLP